MIHVSLQAYWLRFELRRRIFPSLDLEIAQSCLLYIQHNCLLFGSALNLVNRDLPVVNDELGLHCMAISGCEMHSFWQKRYC